MIERKHPDIPSATYRLQFNKGFTFEAAREIVPYLDALGISHVYAAPFFQARAGSSHGYDICDHNRLNSEIGSREDFDKYVAALRERGMGQIADFVPNHMGIGEPCNTWWMDVLENGPSSIYARYFDIDWDPLKEELGNKVLLPILGDQYGRVLENGEFKIRFEHGAFVLCCYDFLLPMAPRLYVPILQGVIDRLGHDNNEELIVEVRSIVTALAHLPSRTEMNEEKIEERLREKEVIKRRLDRRVKDFPHLVEVIEQELNELHGRKGDPRSFDALDRLISHQAYRLSYWRTAAEEINYRRFFDINDLAAIRMEIPEVFDATHRFLFELIRAGAVTGVRIDHVDGLLNPADYLAKLQARYREISPLGEGENGLYLLVEKILSGGEELRRDWPVHGTTGYDFTNQVIRVLIDSRAEKAITMTYRRFTGMTMRFEDLVYQRKQSVMRLSLASEVNVLGHMLNRLSEKNRWYRDFTLNALTTAVREVIACFPVYRTYLAPGAELSDADLQVIKRAVNAATHRNPAIERSVFDFLREILSMKFPRNIDEAARTEHEQFVLKFQQCTGAIMAKGLEDTAFYIFNRLAALNEVGGEPMRFGASIDSFHQEVAARGRRYPHSMLTTSTHDTKRSEDVRARIAAISELPEEWRVSLQQWRAANRKFKTEVEETMAPDGNEEYLLYQTLLGAWPLEGLDDTGIFVKRIQDYMTKAVKEAKVNSSWIQPNEAWDEAVRKFIDSILKPGPRNRFLGTFEPFAQRIAELGAMNSITQIVLKCMLPGVPDIYQGNELWDFSLVDPDNRRPVDYSARQKLLEELGQETQAGELLPAWRNGRIKLWITARLLNLRRQMADLFSGGEYRPAVITGRHADCCIAFRREAGAGKLVVLAARFTSRIGSPPIGELWADTALGWEGSDNGRWRDVLSGAVLDCQGGSIPVSRLFGVLPWAVLIPANAG